MSLYSGGLIIGRIAVSEIWGPYFREGLFLSGLLWEFYGIYTVHKPPVYKPTQNPFKLYVDRLIEDCSQRLVYHLKRKAIIIHQAE